MNENKEKEIKIDEVNENNVKKKTRKKAIIIILIVLLIITLIASGGFIYIKNNNKKLEQEAKEQIENSITLEDKTYEYGTEIKVSDFNLKDGQKLYVNDTEITSESFKLDKLGDNQVKITSELTYKDTFKKEHKISYEKKATYKVEDKTPPEITGNEDKTITVGDTIDVKANVKATDNVDGEVEVKVEGDVDTSKEGQYKVKYTAEDKSGNKTEKENTITVNKKQEEVKETTTNTSSSKTTKGAKSSTSKKSNTSTKQNSGSSKKQSKSSSKSNSQSGDKGTYEINVIPGSQEYFGDGEDVNGHPTKGTKENHDWYSEAFNW